VRRGRPVFPEAWVEWEVRSPDGRVVDRGRKRSQTFVGNALALLYALIASWSGLVSSGYYGTTVSAILDTAGGVRSLSLGTPSGTTVGGRAPEGDTTAGILAGKGTAPVTIGDYKLADPIPHGSGAGQLYYYATVVSTLERGDTEWYFTIQRNMENRGSPSITVYEVGLFVRFPSSASPYYFPAMLARDLIPGGISIPQYYVLQVRYLLRHRVG
jgi:hypothetical protein